MMFYLTTRPEGGIPQPRLYVKPSMSRDCEQILHVESTFYRIFPGILKFEKVDSLFNPGQTLTIVAIFKYLQEDIFSRVSLQKILIQPSKFKNDMLTSLNNKFVADIKITDVLFNFNTGLNCNKKQSISSFVFSQTFWGSLCSYQLSNIHVGVNSNFHDCFTDYLQEEYSFSSLSSSDVLFSFAS